jgi:peptidoglycan/xylan/chitin deacetylase (PgdA/CDA1 family)
VNEENDRLLAILAYHKIGEPPPGGWPTWFYVPEAVFADHLAILRDAGWQVIDAATLLRGLEQPRSLPPRSALITFDDGYRSNLRVALPWLRRFGYPGVMFVPTDYIGGQNDFDHGAEPCEPICDWDELRELSRGGVSIQSHGASHRGFSDMTAAEQEDELRRSRDVLEAGLGRPVELLSYPFGDGGDNAADPPAFRRAVFHAGYRAACLYKGGVVRFPATDADRLTRIAMGPDTDLAVELGGATVLAS